MRVSERTQTYRRGDAEGMAKTLLLVERLSHLPVYELGCTISAEAVMTVYEKLAKDGLL